jgi:hypothetical protein
VTSSYFDFEQAVQVRHAQFRMEAEAERLASTLPNRSRGWRPRMAAALYALAAWLNGGALEARARRAWNLPAACADWCDGVEYWCGFPPPLVH